MRQSVIVTLQSFPIPIHNIWEALYVTQWRHERGCWIESKQLPGAVGLRLRPDKVGRREGRVAEAGLGGRHTQRQVRSGKCEYTYSSTFFMLPTLASFLSMNLQFTIIVFTFLSIKVLKVRWSARLQCNEGSLTKHISGCMTPKPHEPPPSPQF